jgi:hypothetical protein
MGEILSIVKKNYGSIPAVWFTTYVHSVMVGKFKLHHRTLFEHITYRMVFPFAFIYALSIYQPRLDSELIVTVSDYIKKFLSFSK